MARQFSLKSIFVAMVGVACFLLACRVVGFWKLIAPIYGVAVLFAAAGCLRSFAFAPRAFVKRLLSVAIPQVVYYFGLGCSGFDAFVLPCYPIFYMYAAYEPEQKGGGYYGDLAFYFTVLPLTGLVTYTLLLVGLWSWLAGDVKLGTPVATAWKHRAL